MSHTLEIWVDRHGRPCDSERHDAHPIKVVPVAEDERLDALDAWERAKVWKPDE